MALPNSNISVTIVKQAISSGSNDVGTLCVHENINKWSKYKPVRLNKVGGLTEQEFISVKCGLNIPEFATFESIINYYTSNTAVWDYNRPRGGANEPYRLGDFRGYTHNAERFYEWYAPATVAETTKILVSFDIRTNLTIGSLGLTDLDLYDCYIGAAVKRVSGSAETTYYISPNMLIGASYPIQFYVNIPQPIVGVTYQVFLFLAYIPNITSPNPTIADVTTFYLLEQGMKTFTFTSIGVTMLEAYYNWDGTVSWDLWITNNSATQISLTTSFMDIRYADKAETASFEAGEVHTNLGTLIVPANSTIYRNAVNVPALDDYDIRRGYVRFSNASYPTLNKKTGLME